MLADGGLDQRGPSNGLVGQFKADVVVHPVLGVPVREALEHLGRAIGRYVDLHERKRILVVLVLFRSAWVRLLMYLSEKSMMISLLASEHLLKSSP